MLILFYFLFFKYNTASDWKRVTAGLNYTHDLETSPLQIKTDSAAGSEEEVFVRFYTGTSNAYNGAVLLAFKDPPEYKISGCSEGWATFSVDLPTEQSKIWTITKTATTVEIVCNELEVLMFTFAEAFNSDCLTFWSRDTEEVGFRSTDTASDEFRAKPGTLRKVNILELIR